MVVLGEWAFLMSEVPLYALPHALSSFRRRRARLRGTPVEGYLAHKKTNPPRTLPKTYA